jgi:hypothetical protein
MKTRILIAIATLVLAIPAYAEFTLITKGAEVALSDVRLPRNDGGTISFRPCRQCDYETKRVARDAVWLLNGKSVSLEVFRKQLENVANPQERAVTVTRHLKSNRVTKVSINLRDAG